MYATDDPRGRLATAQPLAEGTSQDADVLDLLAMPPVTDTGEARTWVVRGARWVVSYLDIDGRDTSSSVEQDEHLLVLLDESVSAVVHLEKEQAVAVPGYSVAVIPAGRSEIELVGRGRAVRVFTPSVRPDLLKSAVSVASYDDASPAPESGLEPVASGVRVHSLDVGASGDRFGRVFMTAGVMVNLLNPRPCPRDRARLSPHSHDDFEQGSLVVSGRYIHHLRWPWGIDADSWKDDKHLLAGSPSLLVIPPTVIHTSEAISEGVNLILDIFGPPRRDWIDAGWVLNGSDYRTAP